MCCIVAQEPASEKEDSGDGDTFARQVVMRLSVVTFMRPGPEPRGRAVGRIVDYARQIERRGFPGIWVTDSLGRGRPTLDPLVTLGALSVATQRVELGIPVLQVPLRHPIELAHRVQSVLALSGGRLRLGVGSGWNHVEYSSLDSEWKTRGARQAEQIAVLRRLWTEDLVTYSGRFHDLREVAIVPPPIQRPIPIWLGGTSDAVVRRAAEIADGWMPIMAPNAEAEAKLADLRSRLVALGRDPDAFGLEGWLRMHDPVPEVWGEAAAGWRRLGAQMVMLYPMYRMPTFGEQIETLRRFKDVASA